MNSRIYVLLWFAKIFVAYIAKNPMVKSDPMVKINT